MTNKKYHIGFSKQISVGELDHADYTMGSVTKYNVVDICESSNGKIIAFATSIEHAKMIVDTLNGE